MKWRLPWNIIFKSKHGFGNGRTAVFWCMNANAIKELNNKIENQRKQIEESKAENEALKKRIEIMETK